MSKPFIVLVETLLLPFDEYTLVRVYWNLHKKCYSIQEKINGVWKVIAHVYRPFILSNVEFKVYETGRQRVLVTKRKEVHAYVIGKITSTYETLGNITGNRITYNPYVSGTFRFRANQKAVYASNAALLSFASKGDVRTPEITV